MKIFVAAVEPTEPRLEGLSSQAISARPGKLLTLSVNWSSIMKLLIASICCFYLSSTNGLKLPSHLSFSPKRCLRSVKESFSRSRLFSSAAPTEEQKKSGLGWNSHQAISDIPESLVRTIDGNDSMRRKFEALCRNAQVSRIVAKRPCRSASTILATIKVIALIISLLIFHVIGKYM